MKLLIKIKREIQGGSNMTGTDLCVRLYKSVPVIFEPPCTIKGFQVPLWAVAKRVA